MSCNTIARIFFVTISSAIIVNSLDLERLESLGIQSDFYVSDITVYLNRAFLAIPRTVCRNNVSTPTLVEVPWKEFNVILKTRMSKPIDSQLWAQCDDLQNAISLDKEGLKSKLWILDRGNEFCSPKIIAYSLFLNEFLSDEIINLKGISGEGLNSIVIENGTQFGDHRAYVASGGDYSLLVCYLNQRKCSKVKLSQSHQTTPSIVVDYLSMSKLDSRLFMTCSKTLEIYSLDTELLPEAYSKENKTMKMKVKNLGRKLGLSSALETDVKNGLLYYLTRDYAVVRWSIDTPLKAENHDVLSQSFHRMPYVSRLFTDAQDNVHALVNPFNPIDCQVEKDSYEDVSNSSSKENDNLERVIKVMKYNIFIDQFVQT